MKGLLRKDLYTLKNTIGILAAFMLLYATLGYLSKNASMLIAISAVMIMMLPANSISYDEFYHWDRYCLTMPLSRKMVVQSKYVLCALLSIFMLLIGTLFSVLLGEAFSDAFFVMATFSILSLFVSAFSLPLMLKWGAQKGRIILILLCGAAGALIGAFALTGLHEVQTSWLETVIWNQWLLLGAMLLLTIVVVGISYQIACRLYEKKEF